MKPRARKALNVLSLGVLPLVGWIRKIRANRKAVRAGKPRPYPVGELVDDALDIVTDGVDAVKDRKR